jgi:UDPglucose 6-dehydrogenase
MLAGARIADSALEALDGADAAVLVTEWGQLAQLDWAEAGRRMRRAFLVDGRNMLEPAAMREAGFVYDAVGRAADA